MSFSLLFVLVSWISVIPCPTRAQDGGRELYFPAYYFYAEKRLVNHWIKTMTVKYLDECEYRCYLEANCVSLNIKNKDHDSGAHECELNNSTHLELDRDLKDDSLYYYRGAENKCRENGRKCKNNSTCQSGFTQKGYRCSCTTGFEGEHCENDVDECNRGSHKCHLNAVCNNTKGGYSCSCKDGYTGDGHNCTDIDECATGSHTCKNKANSECSNTEGSFKCPCAFGYVSNDNGETCKVDRCHHYQTLNSSDRNINYTESSGELCDRLLSWNGAWYRFQGAAGTRLPTDCPPINRCHTQFPGWLNVTHKPLPPEGVTEQSIKVCFKWVDDNNCCAKEQVIHIKNCGSYFVYKLFPTPACDLRYCGTD